MIYINIFSPFKTRQMNATMISPEDIAGTLLEELFQITKEEIDNAKKSLAEEVVTTTEKPVGTLNEFEQKMYALLFKKSERVKTMEAADEEGSHEYKSVSEDMSLLKELFFNQIKKRFKFDGNSTGIRADFQVVAREGDGEDCSKCLARDICPIAH